MTNDHLLSLYVYLGNSKLYYSLLRRMSSIPESVIWGLQCGRSGTGNDWGLLTTCKNISWIGKGFHVSADTV